MFIQIITTYQGAYINSYLDTIQKQNKYLDEKMETKFQRHNHYTKMGIIMDQIHNIYYLF